MSQSYHKQILDGMVGVVQGLNLKLPDATTLPNAQVYTQVLPFADATYTLPCVQVTTAPLAETLDETEANTDTIGYPNAVTIIVPKNQSLTVADADLFWRQQIESVFHLTGPQGITITPISGGGASLLYFKWEPGAIIDLALFREANLWASAMVFRAFVRKTRP